jgi:Cu(I)/Ag(I) efflux system protein CusF
VNERTSPYSIKERLMPKLLVGLLAAFLVVPATILAQSGNRDSPQTSNAAAQAMADGEIRRVDKAQGKLTIRHGPIPNLDMPPMTMVFQAKDRAVLEQLQVGDKVRFRAEKEGSAYVVIDVRKAP